MSRLPLVLTGVALLTLPLLSDAQASEPHPRDAKIAETIVYGGTATALLTMDRYPAAGAAPHPAIIIVHGGGFVGGTSRNGSEAYCADFLAPAGYAIFSINYRLAPPANFTDMIADVQRSVRFVRHNAGRYGVDPEKIVVLGGSAGGYLSNMVGVLPPNADPSATDPVDRESDKLAAVVTLYGISDIATMPHFEQLDKLHLISQGTPTSAEVSAASPISHVAAGEPPFLFIHGDHDLSVPIQQSLRLQKALQAAGNHADLITIPNGPHATGSWHTLPGVSDWERQTAEWLNRTLSHTGPIGEGIEPRTPSAASHS